MSLINFFYPLVDHSSEKVEEAKNRKSIGRWLLEKLDLMN